MAMMQADRMIFNLVAECANDKAKFAKHFFPKYFSKPFAPFHMELHEMSEKYKFLAVAAPRAHAKTTSFTRLKTWHTIAYRKAKFIILVSETWEQSVAFIDSVFSAMEENPAFCRAYSIEELRLTGRKDTIMITYKKDSKGEKQTIMIKGMGSGQAFRGRAFREMRPDLIICDDMEDIEILVNDDRRRKLKEWFFGSVKPMLDMDNGRLIIIGTVIHEASLLVTCFKSSEFYKKSYSILDENMMPLWVDNWVNSAEAILPADKRLNLARLRIAKLRKSFEDVGELQTFYREYFNVANNPESKKFDISKFRYYELREIKAFLKKGKWPIFMTVDLAHEEQASKTDNCFHAIVVCAYNPDTDDRYIVYYEDFKADFDTLVERFFDILETWNVLEVGIETVGAQKHFSQHVKNERRRRGLSFIVRELKHTDKKHYRIMTLQYPQSIGKYWLQRWMTKLEQQFDSYPKGDFVDLLDATASIEELLVDKIEAAHETGEVYMSEEDRRIDLMSRGLMTVRDPINKNSRRRNGTGY